MQTVSAVPVLSGDRGRGRRKLSQDSAGFDLTRRAGCVILYKHL